MARFDRRSILRAAALAPFAGVGGCVPGIGVDAPATSLTPADVLVKPDWNCADRIVTSIRRTSFPDRRFLVDVVEATAAGCNDARRAIQAAIDAAHAAGGGRVILPAGLWLSDGPVRLKSNVDLHLVEGATLRFLGNPESYLPPVLTRWEGIDVWSYSPFVYAYDAENIAITGSGTIDGQGERHFLSWRREQAPIQALLRAMGHDGVPVGERVFVGERRLRPHFVQFHSCRCVLVDGPTFVDSPFWMIHPVYCTDVIVRNITCVSRHINSDGIDPDSSRRVLIENCRFDVGDDGVAIKSGRDRDGWRVGIPSEDIVVRDCTFTGNTGGGVAIGSEMSGGVRNVWIENWTLPTCNHALYFKANLDRGGLIENVYIRNIDVGTTEAAVILTNDYHSYRGGNAPPRFERIWIERLRVQRARTAIAIKGHPMAPVRHVRIRDVDIGDAESALELSQGEDIRLDDVFVNGRRLRLADAVEWQDRKTY